MFKTSELPARRRTWMNIASIPQNRAGWELDDCTDVTPENRNSIELWLKQLKAGKIIRAEGATSCGMGLLLYGDPGHGKTTVSLVVLQDILRTMMPNDFVPKSDATAIVRPGYFISFTSLLRLKGETMDEPTADQVTLMDGIMGECSIDAYNIRVLVIDDVGKEHTSGSGWQRSMLHDILRTRFHHGLPTIITSNIPLDKWGATYGDASESFAREAFVSIALKSPKGDLRK